MSSCLFFLGTHEPGWLRRSTVPLFVSRRRLARLRNMPQAVCAWALDSGGFSELSLFSGWQTSARQYVAEVRRYVDEIGSLLWAAPQDWMCEPVMLAKTGLSVEEHQRRSVASVLELRDLAPELPWAPVLQGWRREDYLRCWEMYDAAGVDLGAEPIVGVGSVCRRQHTTEALSIFEALQPLRLHGFGLKLGGLRQSAHLLTSADSMAWSFAARKRAPMCGRAHSSCANCFAWAMSWRASVAPLLAGPAQQALFGGAS